MDEFIVYCHCVRSATGTGLTFPLPSEITPENIVTYIDEEFDGQFFPMTCDVIPRDQINTTDDLF